MQIPRVFHQIWIGPDPLPEDLARYHSTWLEHHPGWESRFWNDDNIPAGLRRPEVYDRLRSPVERGDILRYELLWRFGGVYVDADLECLRSIEPLIEDVDFFVADTEPGRVNIAIMGSVPGHPILGQALDELQPREWYGYDKAATGPLFFDRLQKRDYPNVTIFEKRHFYSKEANAREFAYAIHHEANAWKDIKAFQLDARKAATRAQKAKDEAQKWRRRYEEAEARLARSQPASSAQPPSSTRDEVRRTDPPQTARPSLGRTAAFAAGAVAALAVATLDGYDGISRLVTDHNDWGDIQYVITLAWIPIAAIGAAVLLRRRRDVRT
jgi:hypothetical protein